MAALAGGKIGPGFNRLDHVGNRRLDEYGSGWLANAHWATPLNAGDGLSVTSIPAVHIGIMATLYWLHVHACLHITNIDDYFRKFFFVHYDVNTAAMGDGEAAARILDLEFDIPRLLVQQFQNA